MCEMLGYDLQTSTGTQRPMASHWEHGNAYLVVQREEISFSLLQLTTP